MMRWCLNYRLVKWLLVVILLTTTLILPACVCGTIQPSAKVVGQWEGQWESGEYIAAGTAGEINDTPYLFLCTINGTKLTLRVLDIQDPQIPIEVANLMAPVDSIPHPYVLELLGTTLYINPWWEEGGLWLVDVSNPVSPQEMALLDIDYPVNDMAISEDYAYLTSTMSRNTLVFDISDPNHPQEVGVLADLRGRIVEAAGSLLYLIANDGLHIIDVSAPASPQDVGFYADPIGPPSPSAIEDWAESGISTQIVEPGESFWDYFHDVEVSGQYAYIAAGGNGMYVLDISNPSSPTELTQLVTPDIAHNVLFEDNSVYLLSFISNEGMPFGDTILRIIDVTDPSSPEIVDSVDITPPTLAWPSFAKLENNIFIFYLSSVFVVEVSS